MSSAPYCVLIVDDTPLIRRMCARYMVDVVKTVVEPLRGPVEVTVLEADNGEDAERILRSERVDLMVLDLMMPIKDGLSVLLDLKSNPLDRPVDILVCSSMDAPQVIEQALRLGVLGFVSKPLTRERLQERLAEAYQRKHARVVQEAERSKELAATRSEASTAPSTGDVDTHGDTKPNLDATPAVARTVNDGNVIPAYEAPGDGTSAWRRRALASTYPFLYPDQVAYARRVDGIAVQRLAIWIAGVDLDGQLDVLGIWSCENEDESLWRSIFVDIRERGADNVLIVAGSERPGLAVAAEATYPHCEPILDLVELLRRSVDLVAWRDRRAFAKDLKELYAAVSTDQAADALDALRDRWLDKYPLALRPWKSAWTSVTRLFHYPAELRAVLFDTVALESFHRQLAKSLNGTTGFDHDHELHAHFHDRLTAAAAKWTRRAHWAAAVNQLSMVFADRVEI